MIAHNFFRLHNQDYPDVGVLAWHVSIVHRGCQVRNV